MRVTKAVVFGMICAMIWAPGGASAGDAGSAFTYQGQLKEVGVPVDGRYDFLFKLFDAEATGGQIGHDVTVGPVDVENGLFTVELDFGSGVFDGIPLWLDVAVRRYSPSIELPYTTLSPRQPLNPTPYAMYAFNGPGGGGGHWAITNENDVYNTNSGKVGIGTSSPSGTLEVTNDGGAHAIWATSTYIPVYARRTSTGGTWPAVHGECDSLAPNASGVRGRISSTAPGSGSSGVRGINSSTGGAGIGVWGSQEGSGYGVYGTTPNGTGVLGVADGDSGTNYGVRGVSASPSGFGGHFRNTSSDGTALYAVSTGAGRDDATLQVHNTRAIEGIAAYVTSVGSWATMHLQNNGPGEVLWMSRDNTDGPFIVAYNEDTGGRVFTVHQNGWTTVSILEITGGADLSEQFKVSGSERETEPGMAVCIDPQNPGELVVCDKPYDRSVAGIISGAGGVKPGMLMGQTDSIADGDHPVALTGRVWCHCDASNGAIQPGDLLTTSSVPGHAMKVTNFAQAHGAVLGKAMTALAEGQGLVLVLVNLQ